MRLAVKVPSTHVVPVSREIANEENGFQIHERDGDLSCSRCEGQVKGVSRWSEIPGLPFQQYPFDEMGYNLVAQNRVSPLGRKNILPDKRKHDSCLIVTMHYQRIYLFILYLLCRLFHTGCKSETESRFCLSEVHGLVVSPLLLYLSVISAISVLSQKS